MLFPFHDDNPTRRPPIVTLGLIALNTLAWLGMWVQSPVEQQLLALRRGFVPARIAQLASGETINVPVEFIEQGPAHWRPVVRQGVVELPPDRGQIFSTLITCMFMHGGWLHLLGNMWFLWLFGNNVEDRLGHFLYLAMYLVGGLLGTGAHWILNIDSLVPVIGASGAVSAVLGAYAVSWPWARIRSLVFLFIIFTVVELPALVVLGVWFLLQLLEATRTFDMNEVGGVAWAAHVGGFLAGAALMPLLRLVVPPPESPAPPPVEAVEVFERWR